MPWDSMKGSLKFPPFLNLGANSSMQGQVLWIPSSSGKYLVDETLNELGPNSKGGVVALSIWFSQSSTARQGFIFWLPYRDRQSTQGKLQYWSDFKCVLVCVDKMWKTSAT